MHFSSIIITNTGWLLDKPRERARAKTHSGPRRLICIIVYQFFHSFSRNFVIYCNIYLFLFFFFPFFFCPSKFSLITVSFLPTPFSIPFSSIIVYIYILLPSALCLWVDDADYTRLYHILNYIVLYRMYV